MALPFDIAQGCLRGIPHGHYFLVCLPSMAYCIALLFNQFETYFPSITRRAKYGLTGYFALYTFFLILGIWRNRTYRESDNAIPVLNLIQTRISSSQSILIWGTQTELHFLSQRNSPTRFVYFLPLMRPRSYAKRELGEKFISELKQNRPVLLLDTSEAIEHIKPNWPDVLPPLDLYAQKMIIDENLQNQLSPALQVSLQWINKNYKFSGEKIVGSYGSTWRIFELRRSLTKEK